MREGLGACDVVICNATINCCAEGGAPEEAERILTAMQEWGVLPDAVTFGTAIKACGREWRRAVELLAQMRRELGQCSVASCNTAINCCAESRAPEEAFQIFDAMPGWGVRRDAMPAPMAGCITSQGAATVATPSMRAGASEGLYAQPVPATATSSAANATPVA